MPIKMQSIMDFFVLFIIFIKIIFIISSIGHIFLSHSVNQKAQQIDPQLVYWKERTEFIFIVSMAILLVYYFKPGQHKHIDTETSFLFFLFGLILLFTANWNLFIKEAPWYQRITDILK
jgi:hypothetical protein